jgi:hypothetical protein
MKAALGELLGPRLTKRRTLERWDGTESMNVLVIGFDACRNEGLSRRSGVSRWPSF